VSVLRTFFFGMAGNPLVRIDFTG